MSKQSVPVYILAAAILASAIVIAVRLPGRGGEIAAPADRPVAAGTEPAQGLSPEDTYRLEKLNAVCDMVLERQVVPEPYLRYLDGELAQGVADYNQATAGLKQRYLYFADRVAKSLSQPPDGSAPEEEPPPDYYQWFVEGYHPERYYAFIDRLSALALFSNAPELLRGDPITGYPSVVESGSSYGLWAWALHEDFHAGDETAQAVQDYFAQCEALLDQIDVARAAFGAQ